MLILSVKNIVLIMKLFSFDIKKYNKPFTKYLYNQSTIDIDNERHTCKDKEENTKSNRPSFGCFKIN